MLNIYPIQYKRQKVVSFNKNTKRTRRFIGKFVRDLVIALAASQSESQKDDSLGSIDQSLKLKTGSPSKYKTADLKRDLDLIAAKVEKLESGQLLNQTQVLTIASDVSAMLKMFLSPPENDELEISDEFRTIFQSVLKVFIESLEKDGQSLVTAFGELPGTLKEINSMFDEINRNLRLAAEAGDTAIAGVNQVLTMQLNPQFEELKDKVDALSENLKQLKNSLKAEQATYQSSESFGPKFASQFETEDSLSSILNVEKKTLSDLKQKVLPVLQKYKNGLELSKEESAILEKLTPLEVGILSSYQTIQGFGSKFLEEPGNIIRVIFVFKDTALLLGTENILSSTNEMVLHTPKQKGSLNNLMYKTELLYIVLKNDRSVSTEELLDTFCDRIFAKALSFLLPSTFLLESLQIQRIWPKQNKYSLEQRTYSAPGQLSAKIHKSSLRPFSLILNPAFISGSRNDFLIKWHGISESFGNFHGIGVQVFNNSIKALHQVLENEFIIGKNNNVVLKLCVRTRRTDAFTPYQPVGSVSIGGFLPASNPQQKVVQNQPLLMEVTEASNDSISENTETPDPS